VHGTHGKHFRDARNFAVGIPGLTDGMNLAVHSVGELR
jgi:hypothetical protein